jgi:hypothetical protein
MSDVGERLRRTLLAARCNTEMRHRLRELVDDEAWLEPILRELGGGHAVVRELMWVTKREA